MLSTMLALQWEHQIPSLSVHDSLVVPAHSAETARRVLEKNFQSRREVTPLLQVNWPDPPQGDVRQSRERREIARLRGCTAKACGSQSAQVVIF